MNAQFSERSFRRIQTLPRITRHTRRGRCHGTPPLFETCLWIWRECGRAGRERAGRAACAASARRTRAAAVWQRGCSSRCHHRRRGGTSEARGGALARPSLAWAPLGLAPPSLGLASPPLGLAAPPLAPPLLGRRSCVSTLPSCLRKSKTSRRIELVELAEAATALLSLPRRAGEVTSPERRASARLISRAYRETPGARHSGFPRRSPQAFW